MPKILGYYAGWYPPLWLRGADGRRRYGDWGALATHLRFVERSAASWRARASTAWLIYQAKMERKQGFLFRCVDIVMELFAMAATRLARAPACATTAAPKRRRRSSSPTSSAAGRAAGASSSFRDLWSNDDARLEQGRGAA